MDDSIVLHELFETFLFLFKTHPNISVIYRSTNRGQQQQQQQQQQINNKILITIFISINYNIKIIVIFT